jgi:phosphomevalonate kinase
MPTAVSAPGKVLLAGGYLVLDRDYTALVFGLSARIHVLVRRSSSSSSSSVARSEMVVHSPQFRDASWTYGYHLTEEQGGVEVTQLQGYADLSLPPRLLSLSRRWFLSVT